MLFVVWAVGDAGQLQRHPCQLCEGFGGGRPVPEFRGVDGGELLRIDEVVPLVGKIGKSTWRRWVSDGKAPKPEKRGGSTFWKLSDIKAFVKGDWRAENPDNQPTPASCCGAQ